MLIVSEEVAHILFHVDAEAFESDPSQKPGVNIRKDQVHSMVAPLRNRDTVVARQEFLIILSDRVRPPDVELKAEIDAIDPGDEGERIRLVLQTWVGQGPRPGRPVDG